MDIKKKYENNISTLISIGYPKADILSIEGTTGEKEYFEVCEFYQSNLEYNYKNYAIDPSIWFMRPSFNINARAIKSPKYFLIGTNNGVIDFLFTNFKNNPSLFDKIKSVEKYKDLEDKLDNPFHTLMYQANLNFTFYHEMGHLVQFSKRGIKSAKISELASKSSVFNLQDHVDEIDADTFSCLYASGHVYQYIINYVSTNPDEQEMVILISTITTAISLYLLSFPSYNVDYYEKEGTHPHVMIRVLNVINVVIDSFIKLLKNKGHIMAATKEQITKETLILIKELSPKMSSSIDLSIMVQAVVKNGKQMESYLNLLSTSAYGDRNSAWSQRNKL